MQAFVLAKNAREYEHMLKENHCLVIRNPSLGENRQKVKYVSSALKINLNDNTVVTACNEAVGSEWGFEFVPFDNLVENPEDDSNSFKSSIDIIGYVVRSFPFELKDNNNNGKEEKKLTFMLEDLSHKQIYVTLWDEYAEQILEFERNNKDEKNVVIVLQFAKYRFWQGFVYVSNMYTVTRVFINKDIDEINQFKKSFIAQLSSEKSSEYSGLSSTVMKSPTDEFLTDINFSTIGALTEITKKKFVVVLGTIKSFASESEWFYNACKNCNCKVSTKMVEKDKADGTDGVEEVVILECKNAPYNKKTIYSVPRIKVLIRVQDCTGIVTLTMFEREVVKLLNVNANQLLDNNLELANEGRFPEELKALLGKKLAFKIAISLYNIQKKSDGYSVSKLTDNITVISELDRNFDVFQPADEDREDGGLPVIEPTNKDIAKDSVSRTGDDVTPISNLSRSFFTTYMLDGDNTSDMRMEKELKRNLDSVYEYDGISSQSSSKPKKMRR
ncbi:putative replication protein A, OB [Helianthus annuus]|nr:putative replication protein A, OB [Helianthus annuus]